NSGEMFAGGIHEAHSKTNRQIEVGVVVSERVRPNGHVKVAADVVGKRARTNRHVETASGIVMKRLKADGSIGDPAGEAEQSVRALSGIGAGIAAIRWRVERLRVLDRRKAGKREQYKTASPRQRPPG